MECLGFCISGYITKILIGNLYFYFASRIHKEIVSDRKEWDIEMLSFIIVNYNINSTKS